MGNDFHYRWNPQTYAGAGYGVVMIDFHGSSGYGLEFQDALRDDWGGKPLIDLQKGLAAALLKFPWQDGERVGALGASYGGYMINWIAGNWPDRFRCLVSHDKGDPTYPPALQVIIGVSTVPGAQGTVVYTGPVPTLGVWSNRTFGFIAPNNGQYISVSTPGPTRWVHVDNFTLLNGLPLSVEIVKSEASCSGKSVTVSWSTSTEINNDYFIIEKSTDGKIFEEIGIVAGAGNSQLTLEYSFTDYNPATKRTYYRLKQVDFNGSQQSLGEITTESECTSSNDELVAFVNQNQQVELVINALSNATYNVAIYDATGRIVASSKYVVTPGYNTFYLPFNWEANGVYFLVAQNEHTQYTQKLYLTWFHTMPRILKKGVKLSPQSFLFMVADKTLTVIDIHTNGRTGNYRCRHRSTDSRQEPN